MSSRNAVTHGIHTSVVVLRNENNQDFLRLEAEYNALWNPVGPLERVLCDQMISADWRLRRTWQNETAAIDLQMDRDAPALEKELHEFDEPVRSAVALTHMSDDSLFLDNMHRYETRFTRQIDRAAGRLQYLQEKRLRRNSQPQSSPSDTPKLPNGGNAGLRPVPSRPQDEGAGSAGLRPVPSRPQDGDKGELQ